MSPAAPTRVSVPTAKEPLVTADKRKLISALLLVVATLALYNPANRHPFVNYDDDRYVTENPHVRAGLAWPTVRWAFISTEQANWHPLTWLSHAADCQFFGLNPAGHHFTSVLLHASTAVWLFVLLVTATKRLAPSALAAALFALHPINVESVVWIAERKNVLCALLFLATIAAYGWYVRKPSIRRYAALAMLFACALMAKPMAVTLPFVLLLLDYWPLQRIGTKGPQSAKLSALVFEKLPLLVLSGLSAWITMLAQRTGGAIRSTEQFSVLVRMENAVVAYVIYLRNAAWPAKLAPVYPHPGNSIPVLHMLLAFLLLLVISAAVSAFRSRRYLVVGWLWYLGTLVPVIGLIQVGDAAMADRYAYIPLIGIFVMVAFGLDDLADHWSFPHAWQLIPGLVLLVLGLVSSRQIIYWSNNVALWSHTVEVTPPNFIAEDNLGGALILAGRPAEAYPHFLSAAAINPHDPMSHSNLGAYLQEHGQLEQAVREDKIAISLTSDRGLLASTYANLGSAYRAMGQDDKALICFDEALQWNTLQFNAYLGRGALFEKQGKLAEAIADYGRSVETVPTAQGYLRLGHALEKSLRKGEALAAYQQALKLSPELQEAQDAVRRLSSE